MFKLLDHSSIEEILPKKVAYFDTFNFNKEKDHVHDLTALDKETKNTRK
jgi:hypothetical protein